jgi:hypothetical protein
MKVYQLLEHMAYTVEAIEGVRDGASDRAAKLPAKDALRAQLEKLSADCSELRTKIVATKEGGMITGEERIREHVGQLYEAVNRYEGHPSDYQAAQMDSLAHELEDVAQEFRKLTQSSLPNVNTALGKKKQSPIPVLTEEEWQKKRQEQSEAGAMSTTRTLPAHVREMD